VQAVPRARTVVQVHEAAEPPTLAEITDPEALLAAAFATPSPPVTEEPAPAQPEASAEPEVEVEAPASTEHPRRGMARLRAGETLARHAGAGVVIRRAKRA
jgi:hypothetical protein